MAHYKFNVYRTQTFSSSLFSLEQERVGLLTLNIQINIELNVYY